MSEDMPAEERTGKPLPTISPYGQPFWEGTKRHELRIQHCPACGHHQFPPRIVCTHCGGRALEWRAASGRAKVYSFTIIHRPPEPAFAADVPYVVATVDLAEGPRMMTNITGCPVGDVRVGMPVTAWFDDVTDEVTLVKFKPAQS